MKKIFLFAAMTAVVFNANAQVQTGAGAQGQIVQGTVDNGNYTDSQGQTVAAYGLDFNNDGTLEFKLDSGFIEGLTTYANAYVTYRWADSTNVVSNAATRDKFTFLQVGDTVNAASGFNGQGNCLVGNISANELYAGFRIGYPDGMHYGYANFKFMGSAIQWSAIYYNATAGAGIRVGDLPAAIENVAADQQAQAAKFMQDGQLYIRRGDVIYDAKGARVE